MKVNKSNRVMLYAIALSFTTYSCSDSTDNFEEYSNQSTSIPYQTNAFPVVPILVVAIIKIASEVTDGKYYETREYYSNGVLKKLSRGCKDYFGTCTMSTRSLSSGENGSLNPINIDEFENVNSRIINAQILKTDIGILYAIDKNEYPEDAEYFFNSSEKEITSPLIIDNPAFLEELELSETIEVYGNYRVYENEQYRYIILSDI